MKPAQNYNITKPTLASGITDQNDQWKDHEALHTVEVKYNQHIQLISHTRWNTVNELCAKGAHSDIKPGDVVGG